MDDFDPMKATAEERKRALMVILWTLGIIQNHTNDEKVRRCIKRAETALNVLQ